ncbi:hypothetical protein BH10PSE4_BH10PSE4_25650 [soil metagenome]
MMPVPTRVALLLTGLLAVAACSPKTEPATVRSAPEATRGVGAEVLVYQCDNGQALRASYPDRDTALVEYQGRSRILKSARAASGARYVGDSLQWWTQGLTRGAVAPLAMGEDLASATSVTCAVVPPPVVTAAPAQPPVAVTEPAPIPATAPPATDKVVTHAPILPAGSLIEPPRDLGGVLPLKHGIFVASGASCGSPPNAGLRRYDGVGLSGAHTRACRTKVLSRRGKTYEVDQSCLDAGSGPTKRTVERQTIVIDNNLAFVLRRKAGEQRFNYCAASLLPAGLR